LVAVVTIGPSVVAVLLYSYQLFGRIVGIHLIAEAPVVSQLIATIDGRPKSAGTRLYGESHGVSETRSIPNPLGKTLIQTIGGETPDAAPPLELGAGIMSGRAGEPVGLLAAVRLGSNVDVHRLTGTEGEALCPVSSIIR
jgi:hypothetical protein